MQVHHIDLDVLPETPTRPILSKRLDNELMTSNYPQIHVCVHGDDGYQFELPETYNCVQFLPSKTSALALFVIERALPNDLVAKQPLNSLWHQQARFASQAGR